MKNIEQLKAEIADLVSKILDFELNPDDFVDAYDEMLDDCEGEFMGFPASRILVELDPIAYRCGLLDFVNSMDNGDSEEFKDLVDQLEEAQQDLEDLEEDL